MLAQRNEIGGRETIDEQSFERVSATDMAFLQPAIRALSSRDPKRLRVFDDLLFSAKYRDLRKQLGANEHTANSRVNRIDEFEDCHDETVRPEQKNTSSKARAPKNRIHPEPAPDIKLPMEDPLALD